MEKLNININRDDEHLNDFLLCWSKFESRPNKIVLYNTYLTKDFNKIILDIIKEKNVFTEVMPSEDEYMLNDKMFVKIDDGLYLSYVVLDRNHDSSVINDITFLYKDYVNGLKTIQELIEKLNDCIVSFDENSANNLNTLSITQNGLEIEPLDQFEEDENIELYYSKDTFKGVEKVIKRIKKSSKGLTILHGRRGTGKTSIINYISSNLDRIVIFISNSMIEHTINNPDFRKFLMRHNNPVIIIDDCEMFFNEAFNKSNMFVNNLLQMVDGFLSDSISVNVISIFNVDDEDEIDHTLLECNNLIDIVNFSELSIDESNELSKHIGHDKVYKNKTKLIDIIKKNKSKEIIELGF